MFKNQLDIGMVVFCTIMALLWYNSAKTNDMLEMEMAVCVALANEAGGYYK